MESSTENHNQSKYSVEEPSHNGNIYKYPNTEVDGNGVQEGQKEGKSQKVRVAIRCIS